MKTKMFVGLIVAIVLIAGLTSVAMAAPPDQDSKPGTVMGEVLSISGNALQVQTRRGETIKIEIGAQTRFLIRGVRGATIADLKAGDVIVARGRRSGEIFQARLVARAPDQLRDQAVGKVTSIEGETLVLEDKDGNTVRVLTTAVTAFRSKDKPDASLSDIKIGDLVIATGVKRGDTLTAARVGFRTRQERKPGPIAVGEIAAIAGDQITLKLPFAEEVIVNTNANTFVIRRGDQGPVTIGLSDLKVGDKIMALGPRSSDNSSIEARVVMVGREK